MLWIMNSNQKKSEEKIATRLRTSNGGEVGGPEGAEHARSMESSHTHGLTQHLHNLGDIQSGKKMQ